MADLAPEEVSRMTEGIKKIRFLLRDRSKSEWHPIFPTDSIPGGIWVPGGDVKLIIHGFTYKHWQNVEEKIGEQGIFDLGIAYADHNSSYNVLILDWTVLSSEVLVRYWIAAQATRFVGEAAAKFLIRLSKDNHIKDWDSVHAIGFSLGGHAVGVLGAKMQELADMKLRRITGLDPAGPLFDVNNDKLPADLSGFLDKGDAKFVDIIHCNLKSLDEPSVLSHLGSCVQAGHADFYPDGGEHQMSCADEDDIMETCSHHKCTEYMMKSLKNAFVACPCQDWDSYENGKCICTVESGGSLMGDPCTASASGKYFLQMK